MRVTSSRVKSRRSSVLVCLLVCAFSAQPTRAETETPKIFCRPTFADARRAELTAQLRVITGWAGLHFDGEGVLRFGAERPSGGSPSARALLAAAQKGKHLLVFEDASGSTDVAFSRVLEGR